MLLRILGIAAGVGAAALWADDPKAPTFQDLMSPGRFPSAQRGMAVVKVEEEAKRISVTVTGAVVEMFPETGKILVSQRIGVARRLLTAETGRTLENVRITHRESGFVRITCDSPRMTVRVNGDALTMIQALEPVRIGVRRHIQPGWFSSFGANHLVADELGAFGLYFSVSDATDHFDAYSETVANYPLEAEDVLWVAACPPREYDWQKSFADHVVWHWTRANAYPSDEMIAAWSTHGNVVLLQSEVKLWKDWNLAFEPREGVAEFERVRRTMKRHGMRFIVYTSPFYFFKGTPLESRALNSFENFKGWPPGTGTGENMGLFLDEIRKVMARLKPDGLYFDGQYTRNPAALYALAREARRIVGEEGILEWHSTHALGPEQCYLPQADAYVDVVLRGEGRQSRYADPDYLRFFVSAYNISNSIGVLCNNNATRPDRELIESVLGVNARLHTLVSWLGRDEVMTAMDTHYFPKLNPGLRLQVDAGVQERQGKIRARISEIEREQLALSRPGALAAVQRVEVAGFDSMRQFVSTANAAPFAAVTSGFQVRARAHTHAYCEAPVSSGEAVRGFAVKIRHGTDGGMSWGPAGALKFANGAVLRLGTRSDGTLQADINGNQFHGDAFDPEKWVWLRARWQRNLGVVECSVDGTEYRKVWSFAHGGTLCGKPSVILFGKVPYSATPTDYADHGSIGDCIVGAVELLGE